MAIDKDTRYSGPKYLSQYNLGQGSGSQIQYQCAYCGSKGTGWVHSRYWFGNTNSKAPNVKFTICTICGQGTIIDPDGNQFPGIKTGPKIEGLTPEIEVAYEEVRDCFSVNAYTAAELVCRKILMFVACEKGATEGKNFAFYVDYLLKNGVITPSMEPWVERVKDYPNRSAHDLVPPSKERAEETFKFTVMLLEVVYGMEFLMGKRDNKGELTEGGEKENG